MIKRHTFKQPYTTIEMLLVADAKRLRKEAASMRPGFERDQLLKRARQAETASRMSDWLHSPGLRPPA